MNKIIFGFHGVIACIKTNPANVESVHINEERKDKRLQEILELAREYKVVVKRSSLEELNGLTAKSANHQGIVAKIKGYNSCTLEEYLKTKSKITQDIILVLDGITDPQNLGAIIRTAECFGVGAIILPKNNSANFTSEVVAKVSSGAVYYLPIIIVNNINSTLNLLKEHEFWVAGTALENDTVNLFEFQIPNKIAWVMGNEGSGIRRLVKENCDYRVMIPMQGNTQSLNVGVATGIILAVTASKLYR